jgi:hypothetical protein
MLIKNHFKLVFLTNIFFILLFYFIIKMSINDNEDPTYKSNNSKEKDNSLMINFINTNRNSLWDAMILLSTAFNTNDNVYLQIKPQIINLLKQIKNNPNIDMLRVGLELNDPDILQKYMNAISLVYYHANKEKKMTPEILSETFISFIVLNSWQRNIVKNYFSSYYDYSQL